MEFFFPAVGELRQYSARASVLRRVKFVEGDIIRTHEGKSFKVDTVETREGLIYYKCGRKEVPESQLADTISFSRPDERLLAAQLDDLRTYQLRNEALTWRSHIQKSEVRGFVGGRVDLLGHQLYIANEVSRRLRPRVLLADEVGLGKTIEAGLILHRLYLTGRAARVLILVPEPLVNQWFVELLRRFNLVVSVFDEKRCEDVESDDPTANPFLSGQIALCAVSFLENSAQRAQQCRDAGWELMIVDEAHHLEWTPQQVSPAYQLVSELAANIKGLILITATPSQLGPEGHFARLRLLDPERYASLENFLEESSQYEAVASVVDRVIDGKAVTDKEVAAFAPRSDRVKRLLAQVRDAGDERPKAVDELTNALLDEFGTGRVMFRNTRNALKGFPERKAHLVTLSEGLDAKVKWLAALLKKTADAKLLAICHSKEMALEVQEKLMREINVSTGVFHEGMTLLQRDRAAVHFADEEGARILICSEIGSEGRNFQFAHHLVLLDLPENPEVLEQRIGRLDRIGQSAEIQIHVPYASGSEEEVLAKWYHEGLNALEKNPHGALEVKHQIQESLSALLAKFDGKALSALVAKTQKLIAEAGQKLERGQDRLLELNSFKPSEADAVIEAMKVLDEDLDFEDFIIRLLDRIGVVVEEHGNRSYVFRTGDLMTDALPSIPADGLLVTFDRARALARDNVSFLTIDHPLVIGALDYFLGGELGNSSFGVWKDAEEEGLAIDLTYVVECVAPAHLQTERFIQSTPLRLTVDHNQKDLTESSPIEGARVVKGDASKFLDNVAFRKKLLPTMLRTAEGTVAEKAALLVHEAILRVSSKLDAEIERMEDLALYNPHVREEDIDALRAHKEALQIAIRGARHRLDCIRLLHRSR
jgi:ATP-dependent helicase HepA